MSTKVKHKKIIITLWVLLALPVVTLAVIFTLIATEKIGYIPSFEELENPKSNLASEVHSADGKILGKYYRENRTVVNFNDLSPYVVNSLIATEDIRFFKHTGIDFRGLTRVAFKTVLLGQHTGGGSTISQQLAKNLYRMREKVEAHKSKGKLGRLWGTIVMKFQEWITAVLLERNYTKEEIMVMYLNTVTFGHNAYGIKSASRIFFDTTPDSLKLEQAAVLVGLLKAPTYYSPLLHPDNALRRRNVVISQVEKYQDKLEKLTGYKKLTHEQYDSIRALPLEIRYTSESHNKGLATYFREYLRMIMTAKKPVEENYPSWAHQKYIDDSIQWATNPLYGWCNKNFKPDGSNYDIYADGLKIYTTINSQMQQYAEQAVKNHLGYGYKIGNKYFEPLQKQFEKYELKYRRHKPFANDLTRRQVDKIIKSSIRRSERYRVAKKIKKLTEEQIMKEFKTPVKMKVFSWQGEIDTVMTPLDSILYYKSFLRSGFMSMEPQTGYVRAYVGGINFDHFKFDHVMLSRRQVGSTFKPILYTLAMMPGGYSPCYKVPNVPVSFEMPDDKDKPVYTPKFSKSKFDGQMITLKTGLALSLNQISAWVMKQYSPEAVIAIARKMGITSPLEPVYSLCVGSAEVKLAEMVAAYCTFANHGIWVEPILVTRIEDKNGNTISTFKPRKRQVIDEATAYKMIDLMKGVVNFGTSVRLRTVYGFKNEMAGKTGTTNNNSDGWFIGITPKLVSGVWVGGEERNIRFSSTRLGQGANMALPIWALYMRAIYANPNLPYTVNDRFEIPAGFDRSILDCSDNSYEQDDNANYISIEEDEF